MTRLEGLRTASAHTMDVSHCARCGADHKGLRFERLEYMSGSIQGMPSHWALCPQTQQPILLSFREDNHIEHDIE